MPRTDCLQLLYIMFGEELKKDVMTRRTALTDIMEDAESKCTMSGLMTLLNLLNGA